MIVVVIVVLLLAGLAWVAFRGGPPNDNGRTSGSSSSGYPIA